MIVKPLRDGTLVVHKDDKPIEDIQQAEALLADELEQNLQWLARAALLVS